MTDDTDDRLDDYVSRNREELERIANGETALAPAASRLLMLAERED